MPRTAKRPRKIEPRTMTPGYLLFRAWLDAANEWRRLQSDAAEARCRVARAAYYNAVLGAVPSLPAIP